MAVRAGAAAGGLSPADRSVPEVTLSMAHDVMSPPGQVAVERAIAELRSGRPVLVTGPEPALVIGVEALDAPLAARFEAQAPGRARLVLPPARLRRLGLERSAAGALAMPRLDLARIEALALRVEARVDAPVGPVSAVDEEALELLHLALVLPAAVVAPLSGEAPADLLAVPGEAVRGYRAGQAARLSIVSRAPVPLEGARDTEFVVFRGGEGLRDQVAIVVGRPDLSRPVPVRLHSACLTGDLFGSLKCDCGDQLRDTVRWMAEGEGGILLYLDQEGRGNGLANKIRAYGLQAKGFDTYDADEVLGFGLDGRRFDFAAQMLRQLGVTAVRVLTNNPEKIAALMKAGLAVASDERVVGRRTEENVRYLASKRDRAGHFIDLDAAVLAPVEG